MGPAIKTKAHWMYNRDRLKALSRGSLNLRLRSPVKAGLQLEDISVALRLYFLLVTLEQHLPS